MDKNSTQYDFYRILPTFMNYDMVISATQDLISTNIVLNPQLPSGSLPGIKASLQFTILNQQYFQSFEFENVIVPHNQIADGYLAPKFYFPPSISKTNIFNMQNMDYLVNKNCDLPIGYLFSIADGSIYDQMSAFRSKLSDRIQCILDPSTSSLSPPRAAYRCENIGTMTILLELDTGDSNIKLNRLYGEPLITNSGMLPFSILDTQAIIFLDIMNKGLSEGVFQVSPKRCCLGSDCNRLVIQQAISKFVASMNTVRFNFFVMSSQVINQKGYCDFEIFQHGNLSLTTRIEFENLYLGGNVPIGKNPGQSSCTYDQFFDISCRFVDCVLKYLGRRSFPNLQTGYCESTPTCIAWKESYDPLNNLCVPIGANTNTSTTFPIKVDCGLHGVLTPDGLTCKCNGGWKTSLTQSNFGKYQFCTIPIVNTTGGDPNQNLAGLEIGITAFVLVSLCLLFCTFCACLACLIKCMVSKWKQRDRGIKDQEFNALETNDGTTLEMSVSEIELHEEENLDPEEFNLMDS